MRIKLCHDRLLAFSVIAETYTHVYNMFLVLVVHTVLWNEWL